MTKDDKLQAFLDADRAPSSDPGFMAQLDERMARIRLWSQFRASAAFAIAIAAVAFGLYRAVSPQAWTWLNDFTLAATGTPGLALAAIVVAAGLYLPRLLQGRMKV
jgi:hypothetical protein